MTKKKAGEVAAGPCREYKTEHGRVTVDLRRVLFVEEFEQEVDDPGETAAGIITLKKTVHRVNLYFEEDRIFPVNAEYERVVAEWAEVRGA